MSQDKLDTYTDLQEAVLSRLARTPDDEDTVVENVRQFIRLAEERFAQDLRVREMMERLAAPMDEAIEKFPARFLEMIGVNFENKSGWWKPLRYVDEKEFNLSWRRGGDQRYESDPEVYTITGGELRFGPYIQYDEDETDWPNVEILFYASPVPLSDASPTNDILKYYPSIYLYGALIEAGIYILTDQLALYDQYYRDAITRANVRNENAMFGSAGRSNSSMMVA